MDKSWILQEHKKKTPLILTVVIKSKICYHSSNHFIFFIFLIILLTQTRIFVASSLVAGRPAAGRVALGPSRGPSSAGCCSPSPRLLQTCPMTSARGSNPLHIGPATGLPALMVWAKKAASMGRKKRGHVKERSCMTGSTMASPSAQRVVAEVLFSSLICTFLILRVCSHSSWSLRLHHWSHNTSITTWWLAPV